MKETHGKFTSFKALGTALGIKGAKKVKETRKCPNCGSDMKRVADGNVWTCQETILEDKKYKDKNEVEHEVQVFGPCGGQIIEGG